MNKRAITVALAAGTLALSGVATATTAQAHPGAKPRFEKVAGLRGTTFHPATADGYKQVKVIVQLSGRSVVQRAADAERRGDRLSHRERSTARAAVKSQQRVVTHAVRASGGVVYETYQDAYNGIAARVKVKDLAALHALPGVVAVHAVHPMKINDIAGNQYIGGPQAWQDTGRTGKNVTIAVIDTGVDYTHADFGGPGTEAAYEANDPTVIEPGSFPTAKVVGGYDFVGDDYAAEDPANTIPKPDPDPLDCNGHGSHVAGIAAGKGVLADGSTFGGPYNGTTLADHTWSVGPGIAPDALIYAYKVFGCEGSVDNSIVVAALNRAAQDDVDVVNMSLGAPFGTSDDPEVVAVNAMSKAGTVVVASAGNEGPNAYMVGSPSTADRAISVAALDASRATVPGARATFSNTPGTVDLQDSNEAPIPSGPLPVKVLRNPDGTVSLGCDPAEYIVPGVAGALVVTKRGTCARVARAIFGQQAGAAAVVMINTDEAYPPMEGEITENPDTGEPYHVTIPFFGAQGTAEVATTLQAADGGNVTLTPIEIANPGYQQLASFTSGGPRNGDSAVKPDVTAPGVAVLSAGVGTGFKAATISGTSQAAPATAGSAALLTEAHPHWSTARIKAAIMNTADPSLDLSYDPRLSGAGVVQVQRAIGTRADILAGKGQSTLSYGAEQLSGAYSETLQMTIENTGSEPIAYSIAGSFTGDALGAAISASPSTVTVAGRSSQVVQVTLSLDAAAVAALPDAEASNFGDLVTIRGAVVATPTTSGAGIYSLRVPFLVAPRALSKVDTSTATRPRRLPGSGLATSVQVHNDGFRAGNADVYSWDISDPADAETPYDVRAVGVQVLPGEFLGGETSDRGLVFAVNVHQGWSTPAASEVDIPIDANRDGTPDAWVIGVDLGAATAGDNDGRFVSLITDAEFTVVDAWVATAPMNTSTMELPVLASEVGLSATHPWFRYGVTAFDTENGAVDSTSTARYNAWSPAVSTGDYLTLAPGDRGRIDLTYRQGAVSSSKVKGWMVVTLDDPSGAAQADLVAVPTTKKH